jgi:recombination protein RecR
MPDFAPSVTRLIDELKRLPGIGQKTAQRLAFYLLRVDPEQAFALSDAIRDAKEKVRECSVCNNQRHAESKNYLRGGRGHEYSGGRKNAPV